MALGMTEQQVYTFIGQCCDVAENSCLSYFDVCDRMYLTKYYNLALGNI